MIYSSKALSYSIIFFLNFLTGVEYGVILPTALKYLERYGGAELDLGICVAAYSFSSLFSSPIMGYISDKTNNVKAILLISNLFQIGVTLTKGSFMYFMGISRWFIIGGRLVAGIGLGVLSCTFGDVIKNTNNEERSPILSRIMVGRQIGMIIGPAFNFIFLKMSFDIGPFLLDSLSAPGLIMAAAWVILEIFVLLFYRNLCDFNQTNEVLDERASLIVNDSSRNQNYNTGDSLVNQQDNLEAQARNHQRINLVDNSESGPLLLRFYREYIREEVVCVYSACFTVFFMQTTLETFLTPFTKDYFEWGSTENSILYAVCGVEIMIVFLILSFLSKKISDRFLMLIGISVNLLTLIYLIVYLPKAIPRSNNYVEFLAPCFLNVFSLPLIVLSSISLLSKVTSLHTQGMTQGIRRTLVGIANILGPLWSGAFYKQWYILIGVLIGLLTMSLFMTLLSFKYLKTDSKDTINKKNETEQ